MTKEFFKKMGIRALHTFCQALIGVIGTSYVLADVNWGVGLSAAILATILSVLKSVVIGLPEVDNEKWLK